MLPLALCKSYFVTGASGSLFCPVSMSPAQRIPTCLGTHLSTVAILAQGTHSGRCGNAGLFAERSNPADASATCLAGARLATPALAPSLLYKNRSHFGVPTRADVATQAFCPRNRIPVQRSHNLQCAVLARKDGSGTH